MAVSHIPLSRGAVSGVQTRVVVTLRTMMHLVRYIAFMNGYIRCTFVNVYFTTRAPTTTVYYFFYICAQMLRWRL